jgi:hypothetical protein
MKYLEKYGIQALGDLTDKKKLQLLMKDLNETFKEILMYDSDISFNNCNKAEKELIKMGKYSEYWQNLKEQSKKMHDYNRRRFRKLIEEYGQNMQKLVLSLIEEKANLLLNENVESLAELTEQEKQVLCQFNHLSGMLNRQVNSTNYSSRICLGCGNKIHNRKSTAKYCSKACQIKTKNKRRDVRRPIKKLSEDQKYMYSLFESAEYYSLSNEQKVYAKEYGIL